jgi:hypothetical protein
VKRPSKGTILSFAAAIPLSVAAGYIAPSVFDAVSLGASASSLANTLGCTDYKQETKHSTLYRHHDAGTCTFHSAHMRIVTFSHGSDSQSFDQTVRLIGLTAKQSGAFASASGWSISDPSYDLAMSQAVVDKLGGTVVALPTPKAAPAAKSTPTASKAPATVKPLVTKKN